MLPNLQKLQFFKVCLKFTLLVFYGFYGTYLSGVKNQSWDRVLTPDLLELQVFKALVFGVILYCVVNFYDIDF